jgi:putative DNA primase/helicase
MHAWQPPAELPDLCRVGIVALDTETNDEGLRADHGSAWPWHGGYVCGVSVAWQDESGIRGSYFPLRHPESENFARENVSRWLKDLITAGVRIVTQNGLYDWGWLRADLGVLMSPADQLEEIGALATLIDENRFSYGLDALCAWRELPGKDTTLLREAIKTAGWAPRKRTINVAEHIYKLPAHLVGPYAEADPIATLALYENLNPILDREGTRNAYRLDVDLLPMVHAMRRRGIRIDQSAAEQARDYCLQKRDRALAELSDKLATPTGMDEIASPKWKARTFDAHGIGYPRTPKGNPSFKAGKLGWMAAHQHWLPQLIATANKYDAAGSKFLDGHILAQLVGDRVYAEINPHRSDNGGTRSFRFSYSNPPLQQMPSRNEELAPLIRRVFLPEEGELWCTVDCSQQEFRFVVHHAFIRNLPGAKEAAEHYRNDPDTDFHELASEITALPRKDAKNVNFAKIYGAGVKKFAEMIGKPLREAQEIYAQYDQKLPFVSRLTIACQREANRLGYTVLYDGARRHWDRWAPRTYSKGAGPCALEEAKQRVRDPGHPWFRYGLHRANIHTALNALIQGSAARHTKLWMRACWREGIVPLVQMHDGLECSITTREQGELVARLACEAVKLEVPMRADLKFGRSWGNAQHSWQKLHDGEHTVSIAVAPAPEPTPIALADEIAVPTEIPPASLERRICVHCRLNPPDGSEILSAYNDEWLHTRCEEAFTRTRMAEEGIPWEAPMTELPPATVTATTSIEEAPIPPPSAPLEPKEQPAEQSNDPTSRANGDGRPTSGNGHGYPWGEREIGRKVAEFIYHDLKGAPYLKVVKHKTKQGRKSFPQYHWENGHWEDGKPKRPAIPYRLPELLAAPPGAKLWICEGEKDANTLAALGLLATTNPGGAGKWTPDLNKWLAGFAEAYILEDNDAPGRKHVLQVAAALSSVIPDVHILPFRELPEHGDVTDWLEAGGTLAQLLERAKQTPVFAALESTCAADEEIAALDWIWFGRYAIGKIGLLVGLPDEGKGLTLSDIIARITRAAPWPCNEGQAPLGNVLLLTAEDDINDTIVPRLKAADADLSRVTIVKMMNEAGKPRMFSLITDLGALRQKIIEVGDVRMILIDPITAYLGIGKIDSFRATDVRAVLGPLKEFAAELRLGILGVMHFNKKTDVTNVLLRISDSLAYSAAARHVYGIVDDPDNHRKLFVKGKNNLAPRDQKTLAFSFADREVGIDKRTGASIHAPYIVWQIEPVDITATEALQAAAESKSPGARDYARQFLEALLSNGPVASKEVLEAAKENGIARITLRRAKDDLKIEIKKDGPIVAGDRSWQWHLPITHQQDGNG